MASTMKIKKGDTVQILAGKDRGKQGRVIEARPSEGRVIVENLNLVKRHRKPQPIRDVSRMGGSQMTPGGIFDKPSPIDISNVMLVCPTCRQATRTGVHVKDVKATTKPNFAFQMDPTEVGSGSIDWKKLLPAAYAAGVRDFFVEQEAPFEKPRIEAARISCEYLNKLVA